MSGNHEEYLDAFVQKLVNDNVQQIINNIHFNVTAMGGIQRDDDDEDDEDWSEVVFIK